MCKYQAYRQMNYEIKIKNGVSLTELEQFAEMYAAAYNAEPWNDSWTRETATALLTCYYSTPRFMGWAARQGDIIIGCAVGNIEPYYSGDIFVLKEMFVSVNSQGLGAGSCLLTVIKEDLKKMDIKMIILSTRKPIFDFYIKSGFREMEGVGTMIYAYQNN